jgi:hypothetical protein
VLASAQAEATLLAPVSLQVPASSLTRASRHARRKAESFDQSIEARRSSIRTGSTQADLLMLLLALLPRSLEDRPWSVMHQISHLKLPPPPSRLPVTGPSSSTHSLHSCRCCFMCLLCFPETMHVARHIVISPFLLLRAMSCRFFHLRLMPVRRQSAQTWFESCLAHVHISRYCSMISRAHLISSRERATCLPSPAPSPCFGRCRADGLCFL